MISQRKTAGDLLANFTECILAGAVVVAAVLIPVVFGFAAALLPMDWHWGYRLGMGLAVAMVLSGLEWGIGAWARWDE